jgi:hypothetical protein
LASLNAGAVESGKASGAFVIDRAVTQVGKRRVCDKPRRLDWETEKMLEMLE